LLDGGITNGGLPYFAMELVDGEPIDRYCQSRDLSIEQRIDLFGRVGDAVSYGHQHLVIHRDLKPSNILEECARVHTYSRTTLSDNSEIKGDIVFRFLRFGP
jgi:serine/threonine protein kinase